MEWLRPVQDPEIFMSIIDLGLVYDVYVEGGTASVKMTLTSAWCPMADEMVASVKERMLKLEGVTEANVSLVFEPQWDPQTMASDAVKDHLGIW